jgi:hypothetical protein
MPIPLSLQMIARRSALTIAAGLALGLWFIGVAKAGEQVGAFDGVYTGTVFVTSVRAIPCGMSPPCGTYPCSTKDFTHAITVVGGVATLIYLPDDAGKSVVLKAPILRGGIFAAEGKGDFAINMSGTVRHDRITAKAWAWDCEYALNMQKRDKPSAATTVTSAQK